jgi:energy-coupling factor transporter ATP-binding protein EcfA2
MILHSVFVENYKGIRGPWQVDLDAESPNLLEGPNGAGKSTLAEAIERCLLESHNTAGESAEEMRPWETALAPTIWLVFSHEGTVCRITKTFLDSPKALLERKRPDGMYEAIAKGKTADEQVRAIVRGQASRSKERPGERMGLLAVLCSSQGKQDLPEMSGNALQDIRQMLGAQIAGGGAAFEKHVNRKFAAAWTAGGKPKKGKLSETQTALSSARQDLDCCTALMSRVSELESAAQVERARSREIQEALRASRVELAPANDQAQQVLNLRARRTPAVSRIDAATARYHQLRAEIDRIVGLRARQSSLEEMRAQLEKNEADAGELLETLTRQAGEAQKALDMTCRANPAIQQLDSAIDLASEFVRLKQESETLRGRLVRAESAAKRRNDLEAESAALHAPEPDTWKTIQVAGRGFDEATMRLESLALRLELTAETGLTANVVSGEPRGESRVEAGQVFTARGEGSVTVTMPGIGTIRVTGPCGDAAEWRAKQEAAAISLQALLAPFGVSAWHRLEERVEARDRLLPGLSAARAEYAAALGDDRLEDLCERDRKLASRCEEIAAIEPSWIAEAPDVTVLREQAAALKLQWDENQKQARARWQEAERLRSAAEAAARSAAEARSANAASIADGKRTLMELEADGATIAARQEQLAERRRECDSAADALREIDGALGTLPPDAPERADAMRQRIAGLESSMQTARETYQQNEAAARAILLQGPYTDLAAASERVRQLESDEAAETLRLNAIHKLKTAVDTAKSNALSGIAGPVEARATALLERITGHPLARVQLGEGLTVRGIHPEGCTGGAEIDRMSAGEQEQIYFATRLALAEVLSGKERQVLVLDDPLVNTDTNRMARVLELISEKSASLQFIILTCHPGRYLELPNAVSRSVDQLTGSFAGAGEARQ